MKKSTTILLMVAGGMVAFGFVLYFAMFFITGGNLGVYLDLDGFHYAYEPRGSLLAVQQGQSSDGRMITQQQEFSGITNLDISSDIGNIELREGGTGSSVTIEYAYPSSWRKPVCTGENGTLYFAHTNQQKGSINFGIADWASLSRANQPTVIITYPAGMEFSSAALNCDLGDVTVNQLKVAGDLSITLDLGSADLKGISARDLIVSNSCGKTNLSAVTARSVSIENDLGGILCDTITSERFSADSSSGQVEIRDSKLGFASVSSDLGAVELSGTSTTGLEVESDSGSVTLQGELAGRTEIDCDLGGIEITTGLPRNQYSLELSTDLGKVSVDGESHGTQFTHNASAANSIEVENSSGSVEVNFG